MVDSREILMEVHAMKNTLVAVALALVVSALPAYPQNQGPKPPASPSKVLLDDWNEIGRKLTAMAEDFPEDKYDFKPNPAERSFAEQLLHAANANYFFINPIIGPNGPLLVKRPRSGLERRYILLHNRKPPQSGATYLP
jgi:hypothetical protein